MTSISTSFPLSPNKVATINFPSIPNRPPRATLNQIFNQTTIISLTYISFIQHLLRRMHNHFISQIDTNLKLPILQHRHNFFNLPLIKSIQLQLVRLTHNGLVLLLLLVYYLSDVDLILLPLRLPLRCVVCHHDLLEQYGVVQNHLLVILHILWIVQLLHLTTVLRYGPRTLVIRQCFIYRCYYLLWSLHLNPIQLILLSMRRQQTRRIVNQCPHQFLWIVHHYFYCLYSTLCIITLHSLPRCQTIIQLSARDLQSPNRCHLLSDLFLHLVIFPDRRAQFVRKRQTLKDHFRAKLLGHEAVDSFPKTKTFLLVKYHNFIALMIINTFLMKKKKKEISNYLTTTLRTQLLLPHHPSVPAICLRIYLRYQVLQLLSLLLLLLLSQTYHQHPRTRKL